MTGYRLLYDTVLRRVDAETAHVWGLRALAAAGASPGLAAVAARAAGAAPARPPGRPVRALGLEFRSPLGVAAGLDKNAVAVDGLAALGFGFVEIGTVTPRPQPGNPRPRLFRLPDDRAIVNRMGFNNDGAAVVAARLLRRAERLRRAGRQGVVVGVNIGRNKTTPDDRAVDDYVAAAAALAPVAGYLVVNVSSPNTPGLRGLQAAERLGPLLRAVRETADRVTERRVPLLVKIAPDLDDGEVDAIADLALDLGLDGIVATNTTTGRDGLRSAPDRVLAAGEGGLSGRPLRERSLAVLRRLHDRAGDRITLVSVGGVTTAADVRARLVAGASLVQAYTAFIYEGPGWPARTLRGLARHEAQDA